MHLVCFTFFYTAVFQSMYVAQYYMYTLRKIVVNHNEPCNKCLRQNDFQFKTCSFSELRDIRNLENEIALNCQLIPMCSHICTMVTV